MAGEDIIMVRQKDVKRLRVIHKVIEGTLTQKEAADLVSLSERQIRRIVGMRGCVASRVRIDKERAGEKRTPGIDILPIEVEGPLGVRQPDFLVR